MRSPLIVDPVAFDFQHSFPMPDDAELHRAGRQGLLDQREDDGMSDAEWLAVQHQCWIEELDAYAAAINTLAYCVERGLDVSTGKRPRHAHAWVQIKRSMERELEQSRAQREGLLADYANYFGDTAAQRFEAYCQARSSEPMPMVVQGELF